MADLSDVASALVALISGVAYPNGIGSPPVVAEKIRVFEGWPLPASLDADINQGYLNVSVFPLPGEQATTRYLNDGESVVSINPARLQVGIDGQTVSVTGVIPTEDDPHVLHVIVNGQAYHYAVLTTDSLDGVAAALAAAAASGVPGVTALGHVITFPELARVQAARVSVSGSFAKDLRRQKRMFQITVWAQDHVTRTQLARAIDEALADTKFLTLPDQKARLLYVSSPLTDGATKDGIYRRDLIYSVEYGTTKVQKTATVGVLSLSEGGATFNL